MVVTADDEGGSDWEPADGDILQLGSSFAVIFAVVGMIHPQRRSGWTVGQGGGGQQGS